MGLLWVFSYNKIMFENIFDNWFYGLFLPILIWSIVPLLKGRYFWVSLTIVSNIVAFVAALEGIRLQGLGGLPLAILSFRLARPNSFWFIKFYKEDKKKLSEDRFLDNKLNINNNLQIDENKIQKEIDLIDQKKIEKNQIEELNQKRIELGLISYDELKHLEEHIKNLKILLYKKTKNKNSIQWGYNNTILRGVFVFFSILISSFILSTQYQLNIYLTSAIFIFLSIIFFIYLKKKLSHIKTVLNKVILECERLNLDISELEVYRENNTIK